MMHQHDISVLPLVGKHCDLSFLILSNVSAFSFEGFGYVIGVESIGSLESKRMKGAGAGYNFLTFCVLRKSISTAKMDSYFSLA